MSANSQPEKAAHPPETKKGPRAQNFFHVGKPHPIPAEDAAFAAARRNFRLEERETDRFGHVIVKLFPPDWNRERHCVCPKNEFVE